MRYAGSINTLLESSRYALVCSGGSRISGKGVHICKGVGGRLALLIISHFLRYPMKMK